MKITEHKRIRSTGIIDFEGIVQRKAWLCGTVRDTVKMFSEQYLPVRFNNEMASAYAEMSSETVSSKL
jgi:hypothetical protein